MSVLFADLQGFTAFSERRDPREVSAMLKGKQDPVEAHLLIHLE